MGASDVMTVGAQRLLPSWASLICYEIVLSDGGVFVSVNGGMLPSECIGYELSDSGGFVFHQEDGAKFYSWPIPDLFRNLIESRSSLLFVVFENGEPADANELKRIQGEDHACVA